MFFSKSSVAGYILSFGLAATNAASAAVIFDALGNGDVCAPSGGGGSWNCNGLSVGRNFFSEDFFGSAPSNTALAASFTIPSGPSYSLESIALSAGVTQGAIPSAFRVDIKESAADGSPGSSIFFDQRFGPSIQPVSFGVQPTPQLFSGISSTQNVTLSGGSTYWLSLSLPQPVSAIDSQVGWFWNLNQAAVTGDLRSRTLDPATGSIDQGSAWRTVSTQAPAFRIEGVQIAVPPTPKVVAKPVAPTVETPKDVVVKDASSPVVVITHGWQPTGDFPNWVNDMKAAIGSAATVVPWLWSDAYTMTFSDALREVKNQGDALGQYLLNLNRVSGQSLEHLQLIGHSLGTYVNAYAANFLISHGVNVEQVTILDRPFGNGAATLLPEFGGGIVGQGPNLDEPIFQTLLTKGGVTWVDNYFGLDVAAIPPAFGAPFQIAEAFDLAIPNADHGGVHDWYGCTMGIIIPDCVGLPLLSPGDISTHKGFPWSSAGGLFDERPSNTGWDPGAVPLTEESIQMNAITWLAHNCTIASGVGQCKEGSPAYLWNENFLIPNGANYMSFEFMWRDKGDGDYLSLQFGDQLLFNFLGESFSGSDFIDSGLIPIWGLGGQIDQLLFALNDVGDANATLEIRNLRFFSESVPEPSTIYLLSGALLYLLRIYRNPCRPIVKSI